MTDFATYTNAQLNRWAAEQNGWRIECRDNCWLLYAPDGEDWFFGTRDGEQRAMERLLEQTRYPLSSDTAIALLGRWGYEWERARSESGMSNYVEVYGNGDSQHHFESPDCDTARALVVAACGLKESEEQS